MNFSFTLSCLITFEFQFALFIDVIARLVVVKRGFTCFIGSLLLLLTPGTAGTLILNILEDYVSIDETIFTLKSSGRSLRRK